MSEEARIAEFNATSYPYRWISSYLGIDYWIVLAYRDGTATGYEAREIVFHKHASDQTDLRQWLDMAERRARGIKVLSKGSWEAPAETVKKYSKEFLDKLNAVDFGPGCDDTGVVNHKLSPRGMSSGKPPHGLRNWDCSVDGHEDPDNSGGCIHCGVDT